MANLPDNVVPTDSPSAEPTEQQAPMGSDDDAQANYEANVRPPDAGGEPEAAAEQPQSVEEPQAPSQAVTAPPEPTSTTSEPPTPTVTPTVPAEVEQLRQENAALQAHAQQQQQAIAEGQRRQQVDQAQGQYSEYLQTNFGMSPEVAATVAAQQRQSFDSIAAQQQQGDRNLQGYQAKVQLAMGLANRDGTDVTELMAYNDPQSMANASGLLKRVADVESKQVKAKQETVPVQDMSEGQTSGRATSNLAKIQEKAMDGGYSALTEAEAIVFDKAMSGGR